MPWHIADTQYNITTKAYVQKNLKGLLQQDYMLAIDLCRGVEMTKKRSWVSAVRRHNHPSIKCSENCSIMWIQLQTIHTTACLKLEDYEDSHRRKDIYLRRKTCIEDKNVTQSGILQYILYDSRSDVIKST